jgi:hypothetical protein
VTLFLILFTALLWARIVMVGNDLGTLTEKFWNYLTCAFAMNALALILYAMA